MVGHGSCREVAVAIQAGTIPSEAGTVSNSPVPRAEQHMRASSRQVLLSVVSLGPGAKENSKRNQKDSGAGTGCALSACRRTHGGGLTVSCALSAAGMLHAA